MCLTKHGLFYLFTEYLVSSTLNRSTIQKRTLSIQLSAAFNSVYLSVDIFLQQILSDVHSNIFICIFLALINARKLSESESRARISLFSFFKIPLALPLSLSSCVVFPRAFLVYLERAPRALKCCALLFKYNALAKNTHGSRCRRGFLRMCSRRGRAFYAVCTCAASNVRDSRRRISSTLISGRRARGTREALFGIKSGCDTFFLRAFRPSRNIYIIVYYVYAFKTYAASF